MILLRTLLVILFSHTIGLQSPPATASIKGLIRDANSGNPIESVTVEVRRSDGGANYFYSRPTSADGSFEFKNVSPGNYRLIARRADYLTREFGQNGWSGSGVPIHIGAGEAKTGVQFRLTRSGSIAGRITDKDGDPAVRNIVRAIAVSNRLGHRTYKLEQSATTDDLGEYRFWGLHPGLYVVSATATQIASTNRYIENYELRLALSRADPAGGSAPVYYIESIRAGSRDILRDGLQLNNEDIAKVEITLGTRAGTLTGTVVDSVKAATINAMVVLIPSADRRGRIDAYKTAKTDDSGRFQIAAIPPGEYQAFALEDFEEGEWQESEFLRRHDGHGTPVRISESETASVALQSLP